MLFNYFLKPWQEPFISLALSLRAMQHLLLSLKSWTRVEFHTWSPILLIQRRIGMEPQENIQQTLTSTWKVLWNISTSMDKCRRNIHRWRGAMLFLAFYSGCRLWSMPFESWRCTGQETRRSISLRRLSSGSRARFHHQPILSWILNLQSWILNLVERFNGQGSIISPSFRFRKMHIFYLLWKRNTSHVFSVCFFFFFILSLVSNDRLWPLRAMKSTKSHTLRRSHLIRPHLVFWEDSLAT